MNNTELNLTQILSTTTPKTFKQTLKKELTTKLPENEHSTTYDQIALYLYQNEQFDYALKSWELGVESVTTCEDEVEKFELFKNYGLTLNSYGGDYKNAIRFLQKANAISKNHIDILFGLSRAYFNLTDFIQAEIYANEALEASLRLDGFEQVRATINLGDIMLEKRVLDKAEAYYHKGLAIALRESDGEQLLRATLFMNLGTCYKRKFLYDKALEQYREAKVIYEMGFEYELAELYINIATVLTKQMRFDDAVRFLKSSGNYFLGIGHTHNALTAYLNLGRVEQDRAEYRKSIEYFDQAIALSEENENFLGSYILLLYLKANSLYDLKEIKSASTIYEEALELAILTDNIDMIGSIKNGISAIKSYYKQFDEALAIYQENLKTFKKTGNIEELLATYTNLGLLYDEMGYFQDAYETYEKALEMIRPYDLAYLEISILINQAELLQNFLKYSEALEQYNHILDKLAYFDNDDYLAKVYHNMANILEVTMRFDEAIAYTNRAMKLREEMGATNFASFYNILAQSHEGLKDKQQARKFYHLALESVVKEYHKHGIMVNYALFLINLERAYDKAITYLQQSKSYFEKYNFIEPLIAVYDNLAKAYSYKKEEKKAIDHYKHSLALGEDVLLSRIDREELHLAHRVNFEYSYQYLIELLLRTGAINEAYWYFEKFKSQTFRKMLASSYSVETHEALKFDEVKAHF
ncbi:MAG: tetratricopeptide repeat protein [Epsilonproteobacteria bacterium]|nr:tetratricopeptide repeat protein [Campylobacterota bacterium]